MNYQELIERLRSFEIDHEPDGWPGVRMRQISAMCDAIESLLAENERLKDELSKYRDAPVVAWNGGKHGCEWTTDKAVADKWLSTANQQSVPLIVKLGE